MERKRTALISVYNKDGIVEFANELVELGFNIYASGGTHKKLKGSGIPVNPVAELVGGEAILGHRVVTLSREVHSGLLATTSDEDIKELAELAIPFIDLVCVDLYPLRAEIEREGSTMESVIEMTDIGGPTMIRSGAKGNRLVICDPKDREKVLLWLKTGQPDYTFINDMAAKGEFVVAKYGLDSARYRSDGKYEGFIGERVLTCKYGENAWQTPAYLYATSNDPLAIHNFKSVGGTDPSFNNLLDLDRALQTITHIAAALDVNHINKSAAIAVGVKHGNTCGAGLSSLSECSKAVFRMMEGDKQALFGGVMVTNFQLTLQSLEHISGHRFDLIAAPGIESGVIESLERKHGKCRFLVNESLQGLTRESLTTETRFRHVRGGFLTQPNYTFVPELEAGYMEHFGKELTYRHFWDMPLGWAIGSTSNSNTITIVKDYKLLGNGVGQQDRVGAARLAIERAVRCGHNLEGSVAYSDSFFPFPDGVQTLIDAGIKAIFTTSGSVNDRDTISLCEKNGISLHMMPDTVGRGFFGH